MPPATEPSSSSASTLATAAASVAAEINHATRSVGPPSFSTSTTSSHPSVAHGIRASAASGEDGLAYSTAGSSRCGTYGIYSTAAQDTHQQRTAASWSMSSAQQHQQQEQQGGNNSVIMGVDSVNSSYRHPRFVTREDCVPGSRFPRGGGGGGNNGNSVNSSTGEYHQHNQHGFGGMDTSFMPETDNDAMIVTSGWQNPSSFCSAATAAVGGGGASASQQSSSANKRLHSQLSTGNDNGTMPSSNSSRFAEVSSASSLPATATMGEGGGAQMAARLTPMMLSTHGHHGPGSKRMKVLEAADGSQGWANLPRKDAAGGGGNYGNNWRTGDASAVGPVLTVMVPGSTNNSYRRRSSGRSGTTASPPPQTAAAAAAAAARTALATSFPPSTPTAFPEGASATNEDEDSNGGGGVGSCGGDSSPDWNERDESSEEEVASPAPSSGCGHSGKGGKTKTPFMLDPKLWVVVERRAVCTAKQCAYRRCVCVFFFLPVISRGFIG